MIKVNRTYTRPEIDTPWHLDQPFEAELYTQEFKDYVQATYGEALLQISNTVSEDLWTLTFESVWTSEEAYQTYLVDPICVAVWEKRDAHNATFEIETSPAVITQIE